VQLVQSSVRCRHLLDGEKANAGGKQDGNVADLMRGVVTKFMYGTVKSAEGRRVLVSVYMFYRSLSDGILPALIVDLAREPDWCGCVEVHEDFRKGDMDRGSISNPGLCLRHGHGVSGTCAIYFILMLQSSVPTLDSRAGVGYDE
jgi:hypothetical protein